jgi:hypothetical protein
MCVLKEYRYQVIAMSLKVRKIFIKTFSPQGKKCSITTNIDMMYIYFVGAL